MSKYYYNKDYFSVIDNSYKAYWLGFLYADGCINRYYKNEKLKAMNLELTLCNEDKKHLQKLTQCLETNVPIHEKKVKYKDKIYISHRVTINCTKMCYDLIELGCIPQKTYDLKFPTYEQVPYKYMRDFIRGFFDGDGCICTTTMNNKPHIVLVLTGMSGMLQSIADFLIAEKILRVKPKLHKDNRSMAYSMHMYGEYAVKDILDYLYSDSEIYLDRKYQKYIDFYKDYDLEKPRRGVCYHKGNKAYVVTITINGKRIRIGQFKNIKDANEARIKAEIDKMNNINSPLNQ
jgi:hypothetical protein